jgi:hypothetical protein
MIFLRKREAPEPVREQRRLPLVVRERDHLGAEVGYDLAFIESAEIPAVQPGLQRRSMQGECSQFRAAGMKARVVMCDL